MSYLGQELDKAGAGGVSLRDGAGRDLGLEPADHIRGHGRADVGEDQRLLQALEGLGVEAVEEARRDLGGERLRGFARGCREDGRRTLLGPAKPQPGPEEAPPPPVRTRLPTP